MSAPARPTDPAGTLGATDAAGATEPPKADPSAPAAAAPPKRRGRPSGTSTAGKVVLLLEALATGQEGVGVREVARDNDMDKSAVSRLFDQLAGLGLAEKDPVSGRFRAGPRLFALSATVQGRDTLWQAAEPIVRELSNRFNETCYLATREGDEIVFRDKVDCDHYVRYVINTGEHAPLHSGAGGRAVLAALPSNELEAVLGRIELPRLTDRTITDFDELRRQVGEDRQRGYSLSTGERIVGGSAVAAPFYVANGACRGAIIFSCPEIRLDVRRIPEIADAVTGAARRLSARLGHPPDGSSTPARTSSREGRATVPTLANEDR